MKWTNLFRRKKAQQGYTPIETPPAPKPEETHTTTSTERTGDKARKCVYIEYDTHRTLTSLVRLLVENGNENLTVGSFASAIIRDYLKAHKEKINALYREDRGDLL